METDKMKAKDKNNSYYQK